MAEVNTAIAQLKTLAAVSNNAEVKELCSILVDRFKSECKGKIGFKDGEKA